MAKKANDAMEKALVLPMRTEQLQMEAEAYRTKIQLLEEQDGFSKELVELRIKYLQRKDDYRFIVGEPYQIPVEVSPEEKKAMERLFWATGGCSWQNNFGWVGQVASMSKPEVCPLSAAASVCKGAKVSKKAQLEALSLEAAGLAGPLPREVTYLSHCKTANFRVNLLRGALPTQLADMHALRELNLCSNELRGAFTDDLLCELPLLESLDLSFNQLSGALPGEGFEAVKQLQYLNLSGNRFTGAVPAEIGTLSSLVVLKLFSNRLSGALPSSFSGLCALEEVNLSQNELGGGVDCLAACSGLRMLAAHHNELNKSLTNHTVQGWKDLQTLYLQNNLICGSIPTAICTLARLSLLNLANNKLEGVIPQHFADLQEVLLFSVASCLALCLPSLLSSDYSCFILLLKSPCFTHRAHHLPLRQLIFFSFIYVTHDAKLLILAPA
jgi:hypothetical protein